VKTLCREETLPHTVQMQDCIVEGEKFATECPQESDCSEVPITCPNVVCSAQSKQT